MASGYFVWWQDDFTRRFFLPFLRHQLTRYFDLAIFSPVAKLTSKMFLGVRVVLAAALIALFGSLGAGQATAATVGSQCSKSEGTGRYVMSFDFTVNSSGVSGFNFHITASDQDWLGNKSNVDAQFYGRYADGRVSSLGYWQSGDNINKNLVYHVDYKRNFGTEVKEVWAVHHAIFDRPTYYDPACWGETAHVDRLRAVDSGK